MSTTFDIVVRERGITELEAKLSKVTGVTRSTTAGLNSLNSTLANVSRSIRSLPKGNLNLFQGFNSGNVVNQINKISGAASKAIDRVKTLNDTLKQTGSSDMTTVLAQITSMARALQRAARASRDIRPPRLPPTPPGPPSNAPQVTAAWVAYAKGMAILTSAGLGVAGLVQMSDQYTNLKNRINSVALTTDQANQMMARTFQIANAAQAPVSEVGNAYARYYRALQPLGYTSKEVADVTETIAKALKLSGATASETGSVMLQLSQAFAKGKLDGDEFRSAMENFPGLGPALAKALNIEPVGNYMEALFKLKEEGKITAKTMVEAMQGLKPAIDEQSQALIGTFGGAIQQVQNNAVEFFGRMGEQSGVVDGLTDSIKYISDNFDRFGRIAGSTLVFLAVTAIPAVVTAVSGLTASFIALTASMAKNPITALFVVLATLVTYLIQTEEGFNTLKNATNVAMNFVHNIVAETVNTLIRLWNSFISTLSYGMSLFSQDIANSVNQAKAAQYEMRGFLQDTKWSPDYKAPAKAGVITDITNSTTGAVKAMYDGINATTTKAKEYYAVLNKAADLKRKAGKGGEADAILTKGFFMNETSLANANKIVAEQSKLDQQRITQEGVIADYRKKADEASHQRKIQNWTKEASQNKDMMVQQRAKNALIEEEIKLQYSKFSGKKGFEGLSPEEVEKTIAPDIKAKLRANAEETINQKIGDAKQGLGVSKAIKDQNAKPKKESTKATEASEYARITAEVTRTTSALGKYGLEQDALNKLAQIENQMANKKLAFLPAHRQQLLQLITTQVREQAVQKASESIYDSSKGAVEQLKIQEEGLKKALNDKIINQERYNELLGENAVRLAELNIQNKMATDADYALIAANEKKKSSEELYNQLLHGSTLELAKITGQEEALTRARNEGVISQQKYNQEMLKSALARKQNKYDQGGGTFNDAVQGGFMESVAGMGAGLPQVQKDFATFFTGINEGFADSFGKAIVMGEDLKTSLSNVAKQGLAELLSGLIKVGIQWLLMDTLKKTLGIGTQNASSSALGGMNFNPANQNQQQGAVGAKIGAYNNVPTQAQAGNGATIPGQIASIGETTTKSLTQATDSFSGFFSMVGDGFSTVFGQATTQTAQLGLNLQDVAMNGLNTLVQGLANVAVQWLVMEVIGATLGKSAEAQSVVSAGTVASAWAPAAAMASLATLGANAVPAAGAIVGVTALSTGIAMASQAVGFKKGGYTGNGGVNDIAGVVHGKEWVVDAETTAKNRPLLESLSGGRSGSSGGSSSKGGFMPKIVINNMGTPQNYSVESMSPEEIRLTARDEAERVVAKRTPEIMSNQLSNPNSKFSKTVGSTLNAGRRRS